MGQRHTLKPAAPAQDYPGLVVSGWLGVSPGSSRKKMKKIGHHARPRRASATVPPRTGNGVTPSKWPHITVATVAIPPSLAPLPEFPPHPRSLAPPRACSSPTLPLPHTAPYTVISPCNRSPPATSPPAQAARASAAAHQVLMMTAPPRRETPRISACLCRCGCCLRSSAARPASNAHWVTFAESHDPAGYVWCWPGFAVLAAFWGCLLVGVMRFDA